MLNNYFLFLNFVKIVEVNAYFILSVKDYVKQNPPSKNGKGVNSSAKIKTYI